jgi:hypothetical protein
LDGSVRCDLALTAGFDGHASYLSVNQPNCHFDITGDSHPEPRNRILPVRRSGWKLPGPSLSWRADQLDYDNMATVEKHALQ